MKVMAFLIGLLFVLAGVGSYLAAKTVVHEAVGAMLFVVASVCIACAFVIDALDSNERKAQQRAEEQRELLVSLLNEMNKQTIALGKIIEAAQEDAGDRFTAIEESQKFRDKALAFLGRLDAHQEHGNALLKWIGERREVKG